MRGTRTQPQGLIYQAEFITADEERELIDRIERAGLTQFTMNGHTVKRLVKGFGVTYDFEVMRPVQGEPLPGWLVPLRRQAEELAGLSEGSLVQALLQKYPVGATISWHRDKPAYGTVVGVSLGAYCIMQFQRGKREAREVYERFLNPRSAYVLAGEVREEWEHHIPATASDRYSITFRTLAQ
jgi:alkylated DNA repair protein (DNA oxidative demethylase)